MKDKMVSIVFPVYNVEKFIRESIISILNQTYLNIEILVINDGSKDDSINKIKDLIHLDKRIRVITQKNSGLSAVRNVGLHECSGEYVAFIDSDDIIDPYHIETLLEVIGNCNVLAAHSKFERTTESNRQGKSMVFKRPKYNVIYKSEIIKKWAKRSIKIHLCSFLFSRDFLLKHDLLFDESLRFGEDNNFLWKLFSILPKFGQSNIKTYKYLIRANSLMSNQHNERIIYLMEKQVDLLNGLHSSGVIDRITRNTAITRLYFSLNISYAMNSSISDFNFLFQEMIQTFGFVYSNNYKTNGLVLLLLRFFKTTRSLYLLASIRKMIQYQL